MLEGKDGPKILEINSSPGLEGIERTSGVDVAGAILLHAERFVARRSTKKRAHRDVVIEDERRVRRLRPEEEEVTTPPRSRRGPSTARHGG
jgi:ribosomal protein S6--L-glutamate ligase